MAKDSGGHGSERRNRIETTYEKGYKAHGQGVSFHTKGAVAGGAPPMPVSSYSEWESGWRAAERAKSTMRGATQHLGKMKP